MKKRTCNYRQCLALLAGALLATGSCLQAPGLLVRAANTPETATVVQPTTTDPATATGLSVTSSSAAPNLPTTPATSTASATSTTPTVTTTPTTPAPSSATPTAPSSPTTTAPTSKPAAATTTTTSATSTTTPSSTTPSSPAADTIEQPVQFTDANLAAAMATAFGVKPNQLTPAVVAARTGSVTITSTIPLTSLSGLEVLQKLPAATNLSFTAQIAIPAQRNASYDFSPLAKISFNMLSLRSQYWGLLNDQSTLSLTQGTANLISYIELTGNIAAAGQPETMYQANPNGLNNHQLTLLGPWLTTIANNGHADPSNEISLSDNSLTDFSPLKGITASDAYVFAVGQGYLNPTPLNGVVGQPLTFTANEVVGIDGQVINHTPYYSFNASADHSLAAINYLGNGQYQITDPVPLTDNQVHEFTYGYLGYLRDPNAVNSAYINLTYPNEVRLSYDGMIYRKINWQANPTVTINYLDETGQPIQPAQTLGQGQKIGAAFDLRSNTQVAGYQFDTIKSGALTGTYSQDPQTVDLYFQKTHAPIKQPASIKPQAPTPAKKPTNIKPQTPVPAKQPGKVVQTKKHGVKKGPLTVTKKISRPVTPIVGQRSNVTSTKPVAQTAVTPSVTKSATLPQANDAVNQWTQLLLVALGSVGLLGALLLLRRLKQSARH